MVDRVGSGPGYGYPQVNDNKINNAATGTGEKFQLDYKKEGAIYEPSNEAIKKQQADKNKTLNISSKATVNTEENGVKLTLSENTHKATESDVKVSSIVDKLTDFVKKTIDTVKNFFLSIWNESTPNDERVEIEEADLKPKTKFEQAKLDAEQFLASSEGKKIAKNSDLLTYYDRRGVVVSVNPSDKQRILYGDKNQIEV